MTAVLGFESLSVFSQVLERRGVTDVTAMDVARALVRHSPRGMLRFRKEDVVDGAPQFVELDAQGYVGEPRIGDDLDDIELPTRGLYASWPYADDGVPDLPRFLLPHEGWDWKALMAEPAIAALGEDARGWFGTIDASLDLVDREGPDVLNVAWVYDIVVSYP